MILIIFPKHCFFFTLRICGLTDDGHLGKFLPWILAAVGLLTGFPKARLTPFSWEGTVGKHKLDICTEFLF